MNDHRMPAAFHGELDGNGRWTVGVSYPGGQTVTWSGFEYIGTALSEIGDEWRRAEDGDPTPDLPAARWEAQRIVDDACRQLADIGWSMNGDIAPQNLPSRTDGTVAAKEGDPPSRGGRSTNAPTGTWRNSSTTAPPTSGISPP